MKSLSPRARALLDALHSKTGYLEQLRNARGADRDALLLPLGAQQEPALVLPVFRMLCWARDDETRALSVALHHLVACLGPEDVRGVDESLRQSSLHDTDYSELRPQYLDRFASLSPSVMALLTCHPNGFTRQAALQRLADSGDVAAWPFLLVRLNDWVGPVRDTALRAAMAALPRVPLELLVRHFPLLETLRQLTRADHSPFLEAAMARLGQPDALAWLERHLEALSWRSRRSAFRLLMKGPPELARSAVERCLDDADPVVRLLAVEHVDALFSDEELPPVLARLERSRTMFIRREAYNLYARRVPALAGAKVREALMDPSGAIRDYAQRRLSGTVDVSELYRAALREEPVRPGAVAGLGETGNVSDVPRLRALLAHPLVAVRREAVTALGRLDGDGSVEALRELFLDPAPSVCRAAAAALSQRTGRITPEWLRRCLFRPGLFPHALRQALELIVALPRFDALPLLIDAAALPDEPSRTRALHHLERWTTASYRSFSANPSPARLRELREAVRSARHLEPGLAHELEHMLRAYE
ncbi:HEAT repeat domain-containing protein [Archangium sp.]|uniref:HEAT repeat domain-containing protein n=1 Tax=Archangium sp. TaxID=1872627 RepID=UPI003899D434